MSRQRNAAPASAPARRRIHVGLLSAGELRLDLAAAHHLRDVLRLGVGAAVEAFDDSGATAQALISRCTAREVTLRIGSMAPSPKAAVQLTVASTIPKGARADWMIEKLSELGVSTFVPLVSARSVVHPQAGKIQRWARLAAESARQSRRSGVMEIRPLTPLADAVSSIPRPAWHLSLDPAAPPLSSILHPPSSLSLLVGPEGGWTEEEEQQMRAGGLTPAALTGTILRVETAAIAAAAIVLCSSVRQKAP